MSLPIATFNWDKVIGSTWSIDFKTPDGKSLKSSYINDLPTAIARGWGLCAALDKSLDIKTEPHCTTENPGWHYVGLDGFEYVHILCEQGNHRALKRDAQLRIGTYVDFACAGYSWDFEDATKHGVRIVGHETIYTDWWITGDQFYMTNDSKLDSVDLSAISRNTFVEFIPLIAIRCDKPEVVS